MVRACVEAMLMDAPAWSCERLSVDGFRRGRDRPEKFWKEVVRQHMTEFQLT